MIGIGKDMTSTPQRPHKAARIFPKTVTGMTSPYLDSKTLIHIR
jgi:hypothetical protein